MKAEKIGQRDERIIIFGSDQTITHGSIANKLGLNWINFVRAREESVLPEDWNTESFRKQKQAIFSFQKAIAKDPSEDLSVPFDSELADLLKMPLDWLKPLAKDNDYFITINAERLVYLILHSGITNLRLVRDTEKNGRMTSESFVIPIEQSADGQDAYLLRQLAVSVVANSIHDSQFYAAEPIALKRQFRQVHDI